MFFFDESRPVMEDKNMGFLNSSRYLVTDGDGDIHFIFQQSAVVSEKTDGFNAFDSGGFSCRNEVFGISGGICIWGF